MLTYDISRLYGDQKHKVIFHMDSAPSHRAVITQKYFIKQKLKYIPAKEWMPYSADMVSMERAINENLQKQIWSVALSAVVVKWYVPFVMSGSRKKFSQFDAHSNPGEHVLKRW